MSFLVLDHNLVVTGSCRPPPQKQTENCTRPDKHWKGTANIILKIITPKFANSRGDDGAVSEIWMTFRFIWSEFLGL